MFYVIGLHNPEPQYQDTAHNIGGRVLEMMYQKHADEFTTKQPAGKSKSLVAEMYTRDSEIQFVFSETFMNTSGMALAHVEKRNSENVIVIYDDIDLPFGTIRISFGRGDGGHNGIKDIVKKLGTKNFVRIRIGVQPLDWFGRPRKPKGHAAVSNYLTRRKLGTKYLTQYSDISNRVWDAIQIIASEGREVAMNKCN